MSADDSAKEFAESVGMDLNRFNELSKLVGVVLDHNQNVPWAAVMRQCIVFTKDVMEVVFVGMLLGREMQAGLCQSCRRSQDTLVVIISKEPKTV